VPGLDPGIYRKCERPGECPAFFAAEELPVFELRAHRMAIAACFVFQREIGRSVFWDFFDSIDPTRTCRLAPKVAHPFTAGSKSIRCVAARPGAPPIAKCK
jgi:hypothetical protein